MTTDLITDLKDLATLAEHLEAATDDATRILQEFEARLNRLSLALEAWVTRPPLAESAVRQPTAVEADVHGRTHERDELGYGRCDGEWGLLVRTRLFVERKPQGGFEVYESAAARVPLLQAERRLRLKAVTLLPTLLEELKRQARQAISVVEQTRTGSSVYAEAPVA